MHKQLRRGFTIVEILVVVVIISILVLITATIYQNAQVQARDTQVRDAAAKFAEALRLYIANNNNTIPLGGETSSTALTNGVCSNGTKSGFVGPGYYTCTIGEVLIASNYLPADFFTKLPDNTYYSGGAANANKTLMFYDCNNGKNGVVYFTQEQPTTADITTANNAYLACPFFGAGLANFRQYNEWGMRGAVVFSYT